MSNTKTCNRCGNDFLIEDFPKSVNKHGNIRPRSYCLECNRKNNREMYYRRKELRTNEKETFIMNVF